jgi:hypothetical protein
VRLSGALFAKNVAFDESDRYGRCSEQVIITFDRQATDIPPDRPGITVGYVKPPIRDNPSGLPVPGFKGKAFLDITFGAWSHNMNTSTNAEPVPDLPGDGSFIRDIRRTQEFESMTTLTVGLDQKRPVELYEVAGTAACKTICYVVNIQGGRP